MADDKAPQKQAPVRKPDTWTLDDLLAKLKTLDAEVIRRVARLIGMSSTAQPWIEDPVHGGTWAEFIFFGHNFGRPVVMTTNLTGLEYLVTVSQNPQPAVPVVIPLPPLGVINGTIFWDFATDPQIVAGNQYDIKVEVHPNVAIPGDGTHTITVTAV